MYENRDLKQKKYSSGLLKNIPQKPSYLAASKIGPSCPPKNPPNISIYYRQTSQKKLKENHWALQNSQTIPQKEKTKTKNNKFKTLATKYHQNAPAIGLNTHSKFNEKNTGDINTIDNNAKIKKQVRRDSRTLQRKTIKSKPNKDNNNLVMDQTSIKSKIEWSIIEQRDQLYQTQPNNQRQFLKCQEKLTQQSYHRKSILSSSGKSLFKVGKLVKKVKTFQEEMADYQAEVPTINANFESYALVQAIKKEQKYSQIAYYNCYLQKRQNNLTWRKRAIAIDWMMQVLSQFGNKRQTLAKSVSMLDRYLANTINIPVKQLQLAAATCMLIANKLEDNVFGLKDIHQATGCNYPIQEIKDYEKKVLSKIGWKLNPPTSNMWGNRLAAQWDLYLDNHPQLVQNCTIISENIDQIKFKSMDDKSYYNYRWLMQYIDFSLLDIHTLNYQARTLSASFIYIVMLLRLKIYSTQQVIETFPLTSQYLLSETHQFNSFFDDFLRFSFDIQLIQLLPTVQYCSTFVILPLNFDLPSSATSNAEQDLHFQDFCSFQTKNKANMVYLQKRNRNFD